MGKFTSVLRLKNAPRFTADNTVTSVTATQPAAPVTDSVFLDASGKGILQARDNVLFRSLQLQMPYMFTLAAGGAIVAGNDFIEIDFLTGTTNSIINAPGVSDGKVWLKQDCPKIDLNTFVPWVDVPAVNDENRYIIGRNMDFDVSQIYAPNALNGTELLVNVFLVVEHTLELV